MSFFAFKNWTFPKILGVCITGVMFIACFSDFLTNTMSMIAFTSNFTGNRYCSLMATCYASDGMLMTIALSSYLFWTIVASVVLFLFISRDAVRIHTDSMAAMAGTLDKPSLIKEFWAHKLVIVVCGIWLYIAFCNTYYTAMTSDIAKFHSDIMLLSENPHNDQEVRQLKSLFSRMRTREDYRSIQDRINELKSAEEKEEDQSRL